MTTGSRFDAGHYTIADAPEAVSRYGSAVDTLPVGSPGKVGLMELAFALRDGRTELVHHFQKTPLQIMRPLYYDERRPDLPYLQLMSVGGILQGDRLRIDVDLGSEAALHLTTQSATKIYKMEHDHASQLVTVAAGPGSYLEYLPDPVIPFAESRFHQRTTVTVDPSATAILGDGLLAGRLAHGERHAYTTYCSDLEVLRPDGRLLFADTIRLTPAEGVTGPAAMAGHAVMASLHVVTPLAPAAVVADTLHEAVAPWTEVESGVSVLPGESGAWLRLLGAESPEVAAAKRDAWSAVRRLLVGVPVPERHRSG